MGYYLDEQNSVAQTGSDNYAENSEIGLARLILTPQEFSISTRANALLSDTWNTATKTIELNRIKPLKLADIVTPADIEPVMKERAFIGGKETYGGKNGFIYEVDANSKYANELFKLNGNKFSGYAVDGNDNIEGVSPDGIVFNPRRILSLKVSNPKTPVTTANRVIHIHVIFADIPKGTRVIVNPQPSWSALTDIDGVHPVDLSIVGTWGATGGAVDVAFSDSGRAVTGLVVGDFTIPGKTISSATESSTVPGRYTLVCVSLVTNNTLNLVACSTISYTAFNIESTGSKTLTIV